MNYILLTVSPRFRSPLLICMMHAGFNVYFKARIFSRALWQRHQNKGSRIFKISSYSSVLLSPASKNVKVKGSKIM